MFEKYYLAYGSNLNINQMINRCPYSRIIGTTILNNYRLIYKGMDNGFGYLTIEKYNDSIVPLGIYLVSYIDIKNLDKYEGYPFVYSKKYIPITINNKEYNALIYIMNEQYEYCLPSQKYIDICKEGYEDFEFDKKILERALDDTINNLTNIKTLK